MKSRTFDEWRDLGYHVKKGEKATGQDRKGNRTFTRDQCEDSIGFDWAPREEE